MDARHSLGIREFVDPDPTRNRIGARGGPSLACALLAGLEESAEGRSSGQGEALVVSVGEAVTRGIPTAARASISARSPSTGRLGEGQVGGDLGPRLARLTDALVLRGRAPASEGGAVLVIERGPTVGIRALGLPQEASPREILDELEAVYGSQSTLCVGLAGLRGHVDALLVAGGNPSHSVGRGGLGAVFAGLGLRALVLAGDGPPGAVVEDPPRPREGPELLEVLLRSPRLRARAEGGSFELYAEREALGIEPAGRRLAADARAQRSGRHGCSGCPTPCGWTFDRGSEDLADSGARFSATHALGSRLGPVDFASSRRLLGRCDRWGLDAKATAVRLEQGWSAFDPKERAGAEQDPGEHVDRLLAWIDEIVEAPGAPSSPGERPERGAEGGSSPHGLAAELGMAVSTRGEDPMRAFTFAAEGGLARERLVELVHPRVLPPGAEDAEDPSGAGVLVAWHEELSAALDTSGFCSFSAAGLLADGVVGVDDLARALAPRCLTEEPGFGERPGERWLAAGRELIELQRSFALDDPGGRPIGDEGSALRRAWGEYRSVLDGTRVATAGAPMDSKVGDGGGSPGWAVPEGNLPRGPASGQTEGEVELRCHGELARLLGAESRRRLAEPAPLGSFLRGLEIETPALAGRLMGEREPIPSIYRAGRRLTAADRIRAGETLDLVLAIRGG